MRTLIRALPWAILTLKVGVALVNVVTFPRLRPAGASVHAARRVSVLIPARNEALNLQETLGGVLCQGALEVLVLDDESQDQTGEVARSRGAQVLAGQPLAPCWNGKTWACHQLAQAARGEFLLFTDADVSWSSGALDALLAEQERTGADLLSVFPRQANVTGGERLLTPLVDHVLLTLLPAPLLRLRHRHASAANGQVMLFRREIYARLGGHAAVHDHLLEDVALSQLVKAAGGRVSVALGRDLIRVRMYRSYPDSVRGFGKNVLTVHGGSRLALSLSWVLNLITYTLPLLRGRSGPVVLAGLEGLLVRVLTGRTRPADLAEIVLAPVLPLAALPVYLRALRRNVEWKGRHYPQDRP